LGLFAALATKQVAAHGYCVKFGVAGVCHFLSALYLDPR
jgi:hypothetical protein